MLDDAARRLKFPVLRFEKHSIQVFRSARALNLGSRQSFKSLNDETQIEIVDSLLREFHVLAVTPIRRSWHLAYWGGPVPVYILATRLSEHVQLSFDAVRQRVVDQVVRNHWYRQSDQNEAEFRKQFDELSSWGELVSNISLFGELRM
jgi:hypothetical protein